MQRSVHPCCLLNTYYVPGSGEGSGYRIYRTDMVPVFTGIIPHRTLSASKSTGIECIMRYTRVDMGQKMVSNKKPLGGCKQGRHRLWFEIRDEKSSFSKEDKKGGDRVKADGLVRTWWRCTRERGSLWQVMWQLSRDECV